jgi:superfamily II DNA/RNA helicase
MVTNIDTTEEKLLEIRDAVFSFMNDPTFHAPSRYEKERKKIQSMIQSILPNFVDLHSMVDDILFRAGGDLRHSIYFVDTKKDAEKLASVLREKSTYSVKTFYSGKDNNNVLTDFGV